MSRGSKNRLRRQLAAAEERADLMFRRKMAWQTAYYRLKNACEAAIEEQRAEMRTHLAQFDPLDEEPE